MSDQPTNPLLERIRVPGETFRLPSRGRFYKDSELSEEVVDGEVHVLPMTTIDELTLKSPDKLFSGEAVAEVFARRIPQVLRPMDLLSKDVDYLLMCLRLVSYGEEIELNLIHDCENAEEHVYKIEARVVIQAAKEIDPTATFKTTLPNDQVLILKPPTFKDVLKMYQDEGDLDEMADTEIANAIYSNISGMIQEVDGINERELIEEWLEALPAGYITKLSNEIITVSRWGIQSTKEVECPDCNEKWNIDVPSNPITFFT